MDVFELRNQVVEDYGRYVRSFVSIRDPDIERHVNEALNGGYLWPEPLIQLNPAFEPGEPMEELISSGLLHPECLKIFAEKKQGPSAVSPPIRLHRHQVEGIRAARAGDNYVLTTGTGSGKSLAYIVPIVDHVLRRGSGKGIQAIVVYPMNALANSQMGELEKFLCHGYADGKPPVTFRRYTGQESDDERREILADPPDILLTNYVMLELVLTRHGEDRLVRAAHGLRFLVLDELHTYRGRQGADVAMLIRRVREACEADSLVHVGTSATLASEGSWAAQQIEVSRVASRLFGVEVKDQRIIGESLRRVTQPPGSDRDAFCADIRRSIEAEDDPPVEDVQRFTSHPLASWIESNLGLGNEPASGRLVRCRPRPLGGSDGAAAALARDTGLPEHLCYAAIRRALLSGYRCRDENGRPIFAFRVHQFVSKGESVYASLGPLEPERRRYITLQAQRYVPGSDRQSALLPLAFCRECGQEYYVVRRVQGPDARFRYEGRELSDRLQDDGHAAGYLHISADDPWPTEQLDIVKRVPDSWTEIIDGRQILRDHYRHRVPRPLTLTPDAVEGQGDIRAHFIQAPFPFCVHCGVAYDARQISDFGKLATLGSEGRSTATTILSLSTVRRLQQDRSLDVEARKLLSFTDNRQDASLQAGHFNDFVEVALLRAALYCAVRMVGSSGIRHDELTRRAFDALALPIELYASNPNVEYIQRDDTERALRQALGYYLYRDLRRGWRITSPNLEQSGQLDIDYLSLDRFCADEPRWSGLHPALAGATPAEREKVCRVLLDHLRRELAIRVDYLDPAYQEGLRQLSAQYLIPPWSLDEQERLEQSRIVFPRPRREERRGQHRYVYLSPLGGFGRYLKRPTTFSSWASALKTDDVQRILGELLEALTIPGLVHRVLEPRRDDDAPGYQLNASALVWRAGAGERAFHDPVRVPNVPDAGLRINPFFFSFYAQDTSDLKRLHAHEHTAQVPADKREEREKAFREGRLPVLYCSPTMELGVDIRQLNVVNMRNVPPTPANYAQRSGRAGRSGQPAFVFTYCSSGSPHDQYFFKRPEKMVAGAVAAPRLDLKNEDLLRAHVYAIWLGVARLDLGSSLADVLDVSGDAPTLDVLPEVRSKLDDRDLRAQARLLARGALGGVISDLVAPHGSVDDWLDRVLRELPHSFERACDRWRSLYRAARSQYNHQSRTLLDASRDPRDRATAERLRDEALAQINLLIEQRSSQQSDFYSYRYFASEGFLPGYNFPRLPLSAYIEGRRRRKGLDEFLTRPRFLAISEFGPRSIIYHEGSRYVVSKVILPVEGEEATIKRRAALCDACGYLHPVHDQAAPDLCERCGERLPPELENLFRMQNVATRRRDRINSDEEERVRIGYEIKTAVRFATRGGEVSAQRAALIDGRGEPLATLVYGHAATLWRMNLGWRRRQNRGELGYHLDVEHGIWARRAPDEEGEERDAPTSPRIERVVPYVEDTRNCLLIEPAAQLDPATMASLEAALKAAIQVHFQLEDRELATEPLPGPGNRRQILLYESAEGGAGVLRRLVEEPRAIRDVASAALDLCHYEPGDLSDRGHAPRATEDCEAACYDCLLSYFNQRDHDLLDRKLLPGLLASWMDGRLDTSPSPRPREEQLERLLRLCESELERRWLRLVDELGLRLPTDAQALIEACAARPDFLYREDHVAVFIDGPPHDSSAQAARDREQDIALANEGYTVLRFHHAADWEALFARYPSVFGRPTARSDPPAPSRAEPTDPPSPAPRHDPADFDARWHPMLEALSRAGDLTIAPGEEVLRGGRLVGEVVATVTRGDRSVHLLDAAGRTVAELAASLEARGAVVVRVRPDLPDLAARIIAALTR